MSPRPVLQHRLEQGLAALGLALPPGAVERLLDYQALLERWNSAYNLTAVRDPAEMVTRHLLDSLAILPYVRSGSLADLGNGKKVRFLREAIRSLKLEGVRAVQSRVEEVEGQFDCITARAFASLADMLSWGGHLLAPSGRWLAMKGKPAADEMAALPAGFAVQATHALEVPGLGAERSLIVIQRTGADGSGSGAPC